MTVRARLFFLGVPAIFAALAPGFAMARDVKMIECIAQKRLAGYEEPSATAPRTRMPDGTPRYMEIGDPGYAGVEKGKPLPEWLELFGALDQPAFMWNYLNAES